MGLQFTLPALTRAISNAEIEAGLDTLIEKSRQTLVSQAASLLGEKKGTGETNTIGTQLIV